MSEAISLFQIIILSHDIQVVDYFPLRSCQKSCQIQEGALHKVRKRLSKAEQRQRRLDKDADPGHVGSQRPSHFRVRYLVMLWPCMKLQNHKYNDRASTGRNIRHIVGNFEGH